MGKSKEFIITTSVILIVICFFGLRSDFLMLFEKKYTLAAYSGKTEGGGKTGRSWIYKFSYKEVEYRTLYKGWGKPSEHVFVSFYPNDPDYNKLVWEPEVKECLWTYIVPVTGWKIIPDNICYE